MGFRYGEASFLGLKELEYANLTRLLGAVWEEVGFRAEFGVLGSAPFFPEP